MEGVQRLGFIKIKKCVIAVSHHTRHIVARLMGWVIDNADGAVAARHLNS
jgi:hypothetical protein